MQDYKYTIQRTGRMLMQRQVIDHVGVIVICENRTAKVLDVSAMTEYGNYCYHWDAAGEGVSLLKATDDYLMEKFLCGHDEKRVLDWEATTKGLLSALHGLNDDDGTDFIYSSRERCEIGMNECSTVEELVEWLEKWGLNESEVKAQAVYRYGLQAQEFMRYVLPAIRSSAKELEVAHMTMMY